MFGSATSSADNIVDSVPMWLLLLTTLVGALQGAAIGRREKGKTDIVGMAVFALFLGLGGGLARDFLLGLPAAGLQTAGYPLMVLLGFLVILVAGRFVPMGGLLILILDALTLGLYAAIGTQKALDYNLPAIGAVIVGLFAGTTGGVVVSLLRKKRPAIITPGPPYALLALGGILLYLAMLPLVGSNWAVVPAVAFVVITRLITVRRHVTTASL